MAQLDSDPTISRKRERTETTMDKFGLPAGFKTEKGSVYRYTQDGNTERWKYDGTHCEPMGIAVFVEDTSENRDVLTRLGTVQDHLPLERQKSAYVVEADLQEGVARKIFDIQDVRDPGLLYFVLARKNDGRVIRGIPVSVRPKTGSYVFEIGKTDEGRTIRHPGHRVTEIVAK